MIRATRTVSLFWFGLTAVTTPVAALPMAPDECERARTEQSALEGSGVASDMARGADWARAHLDPGRLKQIARWIELEEQILFRCPRPKPAPQSAGVTGPGKDGSEGNAGKPQKPKAKSQATVEASDAAPAAAKPRKTKPERPKKAAAQDAYRPPAPYAGSEFQHAVPGTSPPYSSGTGLAP